MEYTHLQKDFLHFESRLSLCYIINTKKQSSTRLVDQFNNEVDILSVSRIGLLPMKNHIIQQNYKNKESVGISKKHTDNWQVTLH